MWLILVLVGCSILLFMVFLMCCLIMLGSLWFLWVKILMLLLGVVLCDVEIIMLKLVLWLVMRNVSVGVGMILVLSMLIFEDVSFVVMVVVRKCFEIWGLWVIIVVSCLFLVLWVFVVWFWFRMIVVVWVRVSVRLVVRMLLVSFCMLFVLKIGIGVVDFNVLSIEVFYVFF